MGYTQASALSAAVQEGTLSLHDAVVAHLTSNCYPPIPAFMAEPALLAIEAVREEEADKDIPLPAGVQWRGKRTAPALAIIEDMRLEAFV